MFWIVIYIRINLIKGFIYESFVYFFRVLLKGIIVNCELFVKIDFCYLRLNLFKDGLNLDFWRE